MGVRDNRSQTVLSENMISAMQDASDELAARETWVPKAPGLTGRLVPKLITILLATTERLPPTSPIRLRVRANAIRTLAYLEPDMRLAVLLDLSRRSQDVVDDLFSGFIPAGHEVYRFNLFSSLGVFARHGLMREVFTQERLARVQTAMARSVDPSKRDADREGRR